MLKLIGEDVVSTSIPADAITDAYKVGMSMLHELDVFGSLVEIANSYSNFTPRKNAYMNFCDQSDGHIVVYGTRDSYQSVVAMWNKTFFNVSFQKVMKRLRRRTKNLFGSIEEHTKFLTDMEALHKLQYLPLEVRAIDEGVKYPIGLPLFTVKATVDGYGWLVNYTETVTSGLIWVMVNTATKVEQFYLQAKHYGESSAPQAIVDQWLPICVHEFGMRGYRGTQDQIRTSSAHSLFFLGSDTKAVIDFFEEAYDADSDEEPIAVSVRASEHADISRMLSLFRHLAQAALNDGRNTMMFEGSEVITQDVLDNTELYVLMWFVLNSTGIMSYVADTENFYRLLNKYAAQLKPMIEARQDRADGQPAIFVFRPDSSRRTPLTVICGYKVISEDGTHGEYRDGGDYNLASDECLSIDGKYYISEKRELLEISKEEAQGSIVSLWNTFGGDTVQTRAGLMKIINPKVGLIYGEAISQEHQKEIYERLIEMGFSAVNVLMGKGSYASLEGSTRDLFSMSYKQTFSEAIIDGKRVNLAQQKTPMGDISKTSAKGLLRVSLEEGVYTLHQEQTEEQEQTGELTLLLRDGYLHKTQSLRDIKNEYAK